MAVNSFLFTFRFTPSSAFTVVSPLPVIFFQIIGFEYIHGIVSFADYFIYIIVQYKSFKTLSEI